MLGRKGVVINKGSISGLLTNGPIPVLFIGVALNQFILVFISNDPA